MNATYTPEWARDNNPTATMSHAEMTAYYKQHSLRGDALFALRAGTNTPPDILTAWQNLLDTLERRKGKATPALKAEGKWLRQLTRYWLDRNTPAVGYSRYAALVEARDYDGEAA